MVLAVFAAAAMGSESEIGVDHGVFDAFLVGSFRGRGVDYAVLASRRPLLDRYLADVAAVPPIPATGDAAVALAINAYNACTLRIVLDHPGLGSIRDLGDASVWKSPRCEVEGKVWTLDNLERQRVLGPLGGEGHAVVNCASRGCPPLPTAAFRAKGLAVQVDAAVSRWLGSNAFSRTPGGLSVSAIFDWYSADFASDLNVQGLSKQDVAKKWLAVRGVDVAGVTSVEFAPYDWGINSP